MRRKRRYLDGDYGHKRWHGERPVWQVAVAVEPTNEVSRVAGSQDDTTVRLAFHVPHPLLISSVFDRLRGTLFSDYQMTEDVMPQMLNGKCYRSWVVDVSHPDLHRLSISEWPTVIKSMMERRFRVQVTFFDNYEKFLNA